MGDHVAKAQGVRATCMAKRHGRTSSPRSWGGRWLPLLLTPLLSAPVVLPPAAAQAQGVGIPAFLPNRTAVPATAPMPLDGIWRISSNGKRIRIQAGRAFALDSWNHMVVLNIQPGMVVIRNITPTGPGLYQGDDLPLLGRWNARVDTQGNLTVTVQGQMLPVSYTLTPVQLDNAAWFAQEMALALPGTPGGPPIYEPSPPPGGGDGDDWEEIPEEPELPDEPGEPEGPGEPPIDVPGGDAGDSLLESLEATTRRNSPLISALRGIGTCFARSANRNALLTAIRERDSAAAADVAQRCITAETRRSLRAMRLVAEDGSSSPPQSLNVGLGASAGALLGAGFDGGFVYDLNGSDPPRLYLSGMSGAGAQGFIGGDVIAGVNVDPSSPGLSKYSAFMVSGDIGVGAGAALVTERWRALRDRVGRPKGFQVSVGAGLGANLGSKYNIRTRIYKESMPACRDITARLRNGTSQTITVLDLDYWDPVSKLWRSEPTINKQLSPGESWSKTSTLEKVGEQETKLRVKYKLTGLLKPTTYYSPSFGSGPCTDNKVFSHTLTARNPESRSDCRISLRVRNDTGRKIRIVDLDYWDALSQKWRSKITPDQSLASGATWAMTTSLTKMGNADTRLRVEYWAGLSRRSQTFPISRCSNRGYSFVLR